MNRFSRISLSMMPVLAALWAGCGLTGAHAQNVVIQPDGSAVVRGKPAAAAVVNAPGQTPGQPGQPMPGQPGQPMPNPMGEVKPAEGAAGGPPKAISRPDKPALHPDAAELKVRPNPEGRLRVNFTGQPWPDVLKWLQQISGVSLDWQELPGDYLNLVTAREYTVPEVRDLINRHLLARGYTILVNGELMTVEKLDKLNPAVVPRIEPADLAKHLDYEFAKVSFPLSRLLAEQAVEELKPMISPNGKIFALATTNRIEVIDAVINLKEIGAVLAEEQSGQGEERTVRPYVLKHVRADDAVLKLKMLLGMRVPAEGSSSGGRGMDFGMVQQMQQQMQQMMQQMQQNQGGAKKAGTSKSSNDDVHIVSLPAENAILVNAPPDKLAVIEQGIEIIDQPSIRDSRLSMITGMKVYRLANQDPEAFVKMLNDLGGVSPSAQVSVDKRRKAIVVSGSEADHFIVTMLIERLDTSSRSFHVIPLRRLEADYVAGSIRFMLGIEKPQEDSSSRRRSYFFMPFGGGNEEEEGDSTDKFRVDADIDNNRLLLWCNDLELRQIEGLLMKLGELPVPGGNPFRQRVFETQNVDEAVELLRRLQEVWPEHGRNPLKIAPPPARSEEDRPEVKPLSPDEIAPARSASRPATQPAGTGHRSAQRTADPLRSRTFPMNGNRIILASLLNDDAPEAGSSPAEERQTSPASGLPATSSKELESATDPEEGATAAAEAEKVDPALEELKRRVEEARKRLRQEQAPVEQAPAAIQVRIGPNGEIVLDSEDTQALDVLEDLLHEYAGPKRDWKIFKLKYPNTWAYGIEVILKDVFKEEIDAGGKSGGVDYDPFWGFMPSQKKESGPRSLSKRRPLKIISDRDSHTILVQGATREQLRMIEDLINIYDQPQSTDAKAVRKTQIFQLQYSKARVIAEAIKDVYRDLLSENDKALQENRGNKKEDRPAERSYTYIYGGAGNSADGEKEEPIRFKGLLSIGVDESSNILIISATEGLLANVEQIVLQLDRAARPNSAVQVIQIDSRVNSTVLQQKLQKIFAPKPSPQPQRPGQNQPGQNQPGVDPNAVQNAAVQGGDN
jgi:type II secretory pathway component GspD/PulD (secretin)